MKAVGDFYNAGLKFVMGDECVCLDGHLFSNKWVEYSNENEADFVNCTPTKFAWRINPGKKPSFSGLIEFTYNGEGCEMQECRHSNNIDWLIVKKWRPSLNKSTIQTETPEGKEAPNAMTESKPVFTQAMADAGELPLVGSLFIDLKFNTKKPVLAITHRLGRVVYAADYDDTMKVEYMHAEQSECKPIKTEREKAVDAMINVCGAGKYHQNVVETLYDANYRKLTPSQAKAYDDKTEYFGEEYK